jgi:hypothetical protein
MKVVGAVEVRERGKQEIGDGFLQVDAIDFGLKGGMHLFSKPVECSAFHFQFFPVNAIHPFIAGFNKWIIPIRFPPGPFEFGF